jgi:hypothetical protein
MDSLWLLKGEHDAPGWKPLEKDSKEKKINVTHFDRDAWAIVEAPEAPTEYEGLVPKTLVDGMYVSHQGIPVYIVDGKEVWGPHDVIKALGEDALKMLEEVGDADTALQRLGRTF